MINYLPPLPLPRVLQYFPPTLCSKHKVRAGRTASHNPITCTRFENQFSSPASRFLRFTFRADHSAKTPRTSVPRTCISRGYVTSNAGTTTNTRQYIICCAKTCTCARHREQFVVTLGIESAPRPSWQEAESATSLAQDSEHSLETRSIISIEILDTIAWTWPAAACVVAKMTTTGHATSPA